MAIAGRWRIRPRRPVQQRLQAGVRHRHRAGRCAVQCEGAHAQGRSRRAGEEPGLPTLSAQAQQRTAIGGLRRRLGLRARGADVLDAVQLVGRLPRSRCRCGGHWLAIHRHCRASPPGPRPNVKQVHVGAGRGEVGVVAHARHVGRVVARLVEVQVRSAIAVGAAHMAAAPIAAAAKSSRIMSHPWVVGTGLVLREHYRLWWGCRELSEAANTISARHPGGVGGGPSLSGLYLSVIGGTD